MALIATVIHEVQVTFRAGIVAEADLDLCGGWRSCMRVCQFGALMFSAAARKVVVGLTACYGYGICRSVCQESRLR